jgi:hypothetical protein
MVAVGKQAHAHDVSGYRRLADAYPAANPPSPTRKQGQGTEAFVKGS